jgi:hypothetical protein
MSHMPPFATFLTFGIVLVVVALVTYRLLWAASSMAGSGMLPKRLQGWRRWLHGEAAYNKPN